MSIRTAPKTLLDQLEAAGLHYELLPHRRTMTAAAEADALGVDPSHVGKTIVLSTPTGFVLTVLPATERLDLHKVRAFLETKDVKLASEDELAGAYPEFELGAVPATAPHGDRVLVDLGVCRNEFVMLEAGTHEQSLRVRTADLIELSHAVVGDFCSD